jgi:hypothetical protein
VLLFWGKDLGNKLTWTQTHGWNNNIDDFLKAPPPKKTFVFTLTCYNYYFPRYRMMTRKMDIVNFICISSLNNLLCLLSFLKLLSHNGYSVVSAEFVSVKWDERMIMHSELKQEIPITSFHVLSQYSPLGVEENHKTSDRIRTALAKVTA